MKKIDETPEIIELQKILTRHITSLRIADEDDFDVEYIRAVVIIDIKKIKNSEAWVILKEGKEGIYQIFKRLAVKYSVPIRINDIHGDTKQVFDKQL